MWNTSQPGPRLRVRRIGGFSLAIGLLVAQSVSAIPSEPTSSDESLAHRRRDWNQSVGVVGAVYSNSSPSQAFELSLQDRTQGRYVRFGGSAYGRLDTLRRGDTVFAAPEFFLQLNPEYSPVELTFGRKLWGWSMLDEAWDLGVYQPRLRFDYFRPQSQGLFGLFVGQERKAWGWQVLLSPMYLPEQGASFLLKDGLCTSDSPFFACPSSQVLIFEEKTPIRYNLETGPLREIIGNPGLAAQVRVGSTQEPRFVLGGALKPVSQIQIQYSGYLDLQSFDAKVTLRPRVAYHRVVSADAIVPSGNFEGRVSFLDEAPVRDAFDGVSTYQRIGATRILNPAIRYQVHSRVSVGMDYLRIWGGTADDVGPLSKGSGSIFESRFPYREAMRARVSADLGGWSSGMLRGNAQTTVDLENPGSFNSVELQFQSRSRWSAHFGVDLLGSSVSYRAGTGEPDFISRYRGIDRVRGGVHVAF